MPFDPAIAILLIIATIALLNHLRNWTDEYE